MANMYFEMERIWVKSLLMHMIPLTICTYTLAKSHRIIHISLAFLLSIIIIIIMKYFFRYLCPFVYDKIETNITLQCALYLVLRTLFAKGLNYVSKGLVVSNTCYLFTWHYLLDMSLFKLQFLYIMKFNVAHWDLWADSFFKFQNDCFEHANGTCHVVKLNGKCCQPFIQHMGNISE